MSFVVTQGVLATAVADAGTLVLSYPTGFARADFVGGVTHKLVMGQSNLNAPNDFTVTLGDSSVTITNGSGATWIAGSAYFLELDMPGDGAAVAGAVQTEYLQAVRIDLGAPVASDDDSLRLNAAMAAGGSLALIAGGRTLDVPRNIIITSSGNDAGITFVVAGTGAYGRVMSETITGANAGIAAGKKAFKTITTITASGAAAGNVKIGFGDVLGLPVHLPVTALVQNELQDNAAASAGTLVAGLSSLTEATATNADVRGTYDPSAACNGSRAFALIALLPDPTFLGVPQFAG